MNCRDIEQELSAYLDGEVTDAVRAEIEAHIAACPNCRKRVTELKKLVEGTAQIPKQQTAQQFLTEVRRKIAADATPERETWADVLFRPAWLKVPIEALALVVILVIATFLIRPANRPVETLAMKEAMQPVRNGNGDLEAQAAKTREAATPVPANAPARADSAESNGRLALPQSASVAAPSALESPPDGTFYREAAKADNMVMLTGGESMVVLNFDRPTELISVKSDDAISVRDRAQVVASLLNGRVVATEKAGDDLENVYVVVPGSRVGTFKSQFAAAETASGLRRDQSVGGAGGGSTFGGVIAGKLEVPASMAFSAGATDMVDRVYFRGEPTTLVSGGTREPADGTAGDSDSNVVLEIQVIPAKP